MILLLLFSLLLPVATSSTYIPPYSLAKFQKVIEQSKLQAPDSSTACSDFDCANFSDSYFRLDNTGKYMRFGPGPTDERIELRQLQEWKLSDGIDNKMIGDIKFFALETGVDEYTGMQVHNGIKPMARVSLRRSGFNGTEELLDYVWLTLREQPSGPSSNSNFVKIPLIERPSGFFKLECRDDADGIFKVKVNDVTLFETNATDPNSFLHLWYNDDLYFKAGCYTDEAGKAVTQFKTLKYHP